MNRTVFTHFLSIFVKIFEIKGILNIVECSIVVDHRFCSRSHSQSCFDELNEWLGGWHLFRRTIAGNRNRIG